MGSRNSSSIYCRSACDISPCQYVNSRRRMVVYYNMYTAIDAIYARRQIQFEILIVHAGMSSFSPFISPREKRVDAKMEGEVCFRIPVSIYGLVHNIYYIICIRAGNATKSSGKKKQMFGCHIGPVWRIETYLNVRPSRKTFELYII